MLGGLFGQVHLGHLSPEDLHAVTSGPRASEDLRAVFAQAVLVVGHEHALHEALTAAKREAEAYARLGATPYGETLQAAETAVRAMLGLAPAR